MILYNDALGGAKTVRIDLKKIALLGAMILFAFLILFRDVAGLQIPRVVFIAIATILFVVVDKKEIYCFIAFLTPLSVGISLTFICAIALVIVLYKEREVKVHLVGLLCMFAILLMEILSAIRGMFSLVEYIRFASVFLFSFIYMISLDDNWNHTKMLNCYLFGFAVAIISLLGQMLNEYTIREIISLDIRFGNTKQIIDATTEGMRISYDQNNLGVLCLISVLSCLLLFRKTKNALYIISFALSSLLGIMTQSRAFILVYVVSIVLYVLLSCTSVKSAIKYLALFIVGGGVLALLIKLIIPHYFDALILRFYDADVSNGRSDIMIFYFKEMMEHIDRFFIGVGLQNYRVKYGYPMSAHNATQEIIITWGLIGLIIVTVLMFVILRNAYRRNRKARIVQFLPFFMTILIFQSIQGFYITANMARLMVAYSAIMINLSPDKEKQKISKK